MLFKNKLKEIINSREKVFFLEEELEKEQFCLEELEIKFKNDFEIFFIDNFQAKKGKYNNLQIEFQKCMTNFSYYEGKIIFGGIEHSDKLYYKSTDGYWFTLLKDGRPTKYTIKKKEDPKFPFDETKIMEYINFIENKIDISICILTTEIEDKFDEKRG